MYTQLLSTALGKRRQSDDGATSGEMLAELLRCRVQLDANTPSHTGIGWAPAGVADQLAYDSALIELTRHLGVECDVRGFKRPQHQRTLLERALVSEGIGLDQLDGQAQPAQRQV